MSSHLDTELEFHRDDFRRVINTMVPSHHREALTSALDLTSISDFDKAGAKLAGEEMDKGSIILPTGAPVGSRSSFWAFVKSEVYKYFCTNSKEYAKERKEALGHLDKIISIIATALAAQLNVGIGVVVGAVTMAVMSLLKIGKNAWCAMEAGK